MRTSPTSSPPSAPARSRPLTTVVLALLTGLLLLTAAACGSSSSSDTAEAEAAAPGETQPATTSLPIDQVPAGSTLRVGDQVGALKIPDELSGSTADAPYGIEYSNFIGGPLLLEAFRANAVDIGYVADTPPVFAQAADADVTIVAAWQNTGNSYAIVAKPGSDLKTVADLKGKQLAYQEGTVAQTFALQAFQEAGLTSQDVEHVELNVLDVQGVVQKGDVDAGVITEPFLSSYIQNNPDAIILSDADGLSTGLTYLIASTKSLKDPAKAALIGDYIDRHLEAVQFVNDHPGQFLEQFYQGSQGLSPEAAASLSARLGPWKIRVLDQTIFDLQQGVADLFSDAGVIPEPLDASKEFDTRFNPVIAPHATPS